MTPHEIVDLLDQFRVQSQSERSLPEDLPAGREILALPLEDQRQAFLAIYGCLLDDVEPFVSRGEGLEYMNEGWSFKKLHAELGIRNLPLSDDDFYKIINTGLSWEGQFSFILYQLESHYSGRSLPSAVKAAVTDARQLLSEIHEAFAGDGLEQGYLDDQIERCDDLLNAGT
ncbi:hypothetical protein Pan153_43200 [Gimesia panareensis]|uniref:Uncharacterized protein n=1 Tax=Gimesia panareensis TaxID=2527978 RepID=A0A518FTI4_9PLAN|nr:hypothetical protein [Gimesia panareensis]QDV19654.1 hypothetical protein Pan153_43200 [Gimesia panareensis]